MIERGTTLVLGATLPLAGFAPSMTGRFYGVHRGLLIFPQPKSATVRVLSVAVLPPTPPTDESVDELRRRPRPTH